MEPQKAKAEQSLPVRQPAAPGNGLDRRWHLKQLLYQTSARVGSRSYFGHISCA